MSCQGYQGAKSELAPLAIAYKLQWVAITDRNTLQIQTLSFDDIPANGII